MKESWTEHGDASGRAYFYDSVSGVSQWERPAALAPAALAEATQPARDDLGLHRGRDHHSLRGCLASSAAVRGLVASIVDRCGVPALPRVRRSESTAPVCADGRGGAFCCSENAIYLCDHAWVSCRELAYELSHALNACDGTVRCARGGWQVRDGMDCGYFSPPDLACSEVRAAFWAGRCESRRGPHLKQCLEYHGRWAVQACYPSDEHLEAHVRYARHRCMPPRAQSEIDGVSPDAAST